MELPSQVPLLLSLWWFLFVDIGTGNGCRHKHTGSWTGNSTRRRGLHQGAGSRGRGAACTSTVGVLAGACASGEVLAEGVLTILLAQVVSSPDGGADPNTCDADYHDDDEDDPLPVGGEPIKEEDKTKY